MYTVTFHVLFFFSRWEKEELKKNVTTCISDIFILIIQKVR